MLQSLAFTHQRELGSSQAHWRELATDWLMGVVSVERVNYFHNIRLQSVNSDLPYVQYPYILNVVVNLKQQGPGLRQVVYETVMINVISKALL